MKQLIFRLLVSLLVTSSLGACERPPIPAPSFGELAKRFEGLQKKQQAVSVKRNMRATQVAVEFYAVDHAGRYPTSIDDAFKSYFPGGANTESPAANGPQPLTNPFTGKAEWPSLGTIRDVKLARASAPQPIEPGKIEYSPIRGGESYAIIGGVHNGKALPTNWDASEEEKKMFVLSNETSSR